MKKNKIRVVHLITGLGAGGAEKVVLDLCRIQQEEGLNPIVISITDHPKLLPRFESLGIKVIFLNISKKIIHIARAVIYIHRLIREQQINILHCHMYHPLILAYLLKFFRPRLKVVFTSHNFNIGSKSREFVTRYTKMFRNADIVFSKNMITPIYKKNATYIIPNGIQFSDYELSLPKNPVFTFINVARLEPVKHHQLLIEAASLIDKQHNFEIWIAGEGTQEGELKNSIHSFSVETRVKLLGFRQDIPELMSRSHCFILSSLWEGLPISLLEACASAIPMITTSVGSIPEVFPADKTVYITDDPGIVAAKMTDVMSNYAHFARLANKLREDMRQVYELRAVANAHLNLYLSLLTQK